MRTSRLAATLLLVALLVLTSSDAAGPARGRGPVPRLSLHEDLPRDPLVALGIWLESPEVEYRKLVRVVGRFAGGAAGHEGLGPLEWLDGSLAEPLRTELLPLVGPEIAFAIDFPPIDEAVSALQVSEHEALATLLGRTGLLARVTDAARLDGALRRLVRESGGEVVEKEGLVEVALPIGLVAADGTSSTSPRLRAFYALRDDRWAIGFSAPWVRSALGPRPQGERLTDGTDFKAVFARLDPGPRDLTYVNLPKLRSYVANSQVARIVLQSNAELRAFVDRFFTTESMGVGLGSTSVLIGDGVRTASFGPTWLSGTAVSSGILAALALPNLMAAVDQGRTERTVSDIMAIAAACEGFSTDSRSYPGPTDGWVPVQNIATFLEPVYIGSLPLTDGWQNPILYWSDGGSYRILSMGRDGRIDRDWTRETDPVASAGLDADIVFGDGRPLAWPLDLPSD